MKEGDKKYCEIGGEKFRWYWRHRHRCIICGRIVCRKHYTLSHLPEYIKELNFDKVEICDIDIQDNLSELKQTRLDEVVEIYSRARQIGYDDGYGEPVNRQEYDEVKELAYHNPNTIAFKAFKKGYSEGHEDGKAKRSSEREQEEREKLERERKE